MPEWIINQPGLITCHEQTLQQDFLSFHWFLKDLLISQANVDKKTNLLSEIFSVFAEWHSDGRSLIYILIGGETCEKSQCSSDEE